MTFYAFAALVNLFTTLTLGFIVFVKNPRNKLNLYFSIFSVDVALWSLCYFIWQISNTESQALFWSKALMAFAIFIPATYFHFVSTMIGIVNKVKYILWLSYGVFVLFLVANIFSSLFVASVKPMPPFSYWPIAGPLFPVFLLIWIGLVVYGNYLFYVAHRKVDGVTKQQIKYILLGEIFAFGGGSTNYFMWFGIPVLPLGNILVSVYVALTAYVIIKHRFLDIRLVIARTISFTLLTAIFALAYAFIFTIPTFLLATTITRLQTVIISTILAALMAFTFQPLRRILEKVTDKIFFKDRYDSSKLLYDLALTMASTLRLEDLAHKLLSTLLQQIKISRGMFALMEKGQIYAVFHEGYSSYNYSLGLNEKEIGELIHLNKTLISEELAEGNIKEMLRKLDSTLVIPLKLGETYAGLLILGEKLSGDIYTPEDIRVLETLAPEAAVAIQNTKSYEEIRKFNITLQQEVTKATADLQHANTRLKELDKLKDDFVSVASHELRTPMTAIRSYAWMALNRPDVTLTEKMKKYLSRTLISTERLINLVNDMLNVSRIEAGRIEIRPTPFEIPVLVDDVITEVGPKASEKMIHLQNQKIQLPKVFADPDKVHQILLNLIGNALKFTPTSGTITVSFFTDGQVVDISVKDSGVGISKDDMPRLFQKFGRLDNSYVAAATSGGTGLGLFICKNLVELMGGKIWVSSEGMGKGTTFTFSLPIASPAILAQAEKFTRKAVGGDVKELEPVAI